MLVLHGISWVVTAIRLATEKYPRREREPTSAAKDVFLLVTMLGFFAWCAWLLGSSTDSTGDMLRRRGPDSESESSLRDAVVLVPGEGARLRDLRTPREPAALSVQGMRLLWVQPDPREWAPERSDRAVPVQSLTLQARRQDPIEVPSESWSLCVGVLSGACDGLTVQ